MNADVKEKWVKALRSGEYTQGQGKLRVDNTFCCLGVLCDLHAKETGEVWEGEYYHGEREVLPEKVARWAGLDSTCPSARFDGRMTKLSHENDDGVSFASIAAAIERFL